MKQFLLQCLYFGVLLVGLDLGLIAYRNYLLPDDPYSIFSEEFEKNILLGDSHAYEVGDISAYGYSNLSYVSDNYVDMERKLRYVLSKSEVDTVLLAADLHTLSPYRENMNNNIFTEQLYTVDQLGSYSAYLSKAVMPRVVPLTDRFFRQMVNIYSRAYWQKLWAKAQQGSGAAVELWKDKPEELRLQAAEKRYAQQIGSHTQASKILEDALMNIFELCKKEGIVVIGVQLPLSTEYRTYIDSENAVGVDSMFAANGIVTLSFLDQLDDDNYFKDQDHLSPEGAAAFRPIFFNKIRGTGN